jgi:hypothetical protein
VTVLSARDKGAHAELLFCAEAGARGYTIFTPLVGSPRGRRLPQDGSRPLHWHPSQARLLSTQADGYYKVSTSSRNKKYSTGDFDVLAAYLPDLHEFVFWHLAEVAHYGQISYSPVRHRDPGNWELLDALAESSPTNQ